MKYKWKSIYCSQRSIYLRRVNQEQIKKLMSNQFRKKNNRAVNTTKEFLETVRICSWIKGIKMDNVTRQETYWSKFSLRKQTTMFTLMKSLNSKPQNTLKALANITATLWHRLKNQQHKLSTKQLPRGEDNRKKKTIGRDSRFTQVILRVHSHPYIFW